MTTTSLTPSSRRQWAEWTGRAALATCSALLGTATAGAHGGLLAGSIAAWFLAAVAWAVVYPEYSAPLFRNADRWALAAAATAVTVAGVASVVAGSPALFLAWVGGICAAWVVLAPTFYVRLPSAR